MARCCGTAVCHCVAKRCCCGGGGGTPTLSDAPDSASWPPLTCSPLNPPSGSKDFCFLRKKSSLTPNTSSLCEMPTAPTRHTHPTPIPVGHQFTDSSGTPPPARPSPGAIHGCVNFHRCSGIFHSPEFLSCGSRRRRRRRRRCTRQHCGERVDAVTEVFRSPNPGGAGAGVNGTASLSLAILLKPHPSGHQPEG